MDAIVEVGLKLLAAILMCIIGIVLDKVAKYYGAKKDSADSSSMDEIIYTFVAAADQLLKSDDPDGTKRLQYVEQNLSKLGIVVNDFVRAKIEAFVLNMPKDIDG